MKDILCEDDDSVINWKQHKFFLFCIPNFGWTKARTALENYLTNITNIGQDHIIYRGEKLEDLSPSEREEMNRFSSSLPKIEYLFT